MSDPQQDDHFRQIVQMLSQGLIVIDRDLNVLFWNRWMERQTRLDAAEAVGKRLTDLFPEIERKGLRWKIDSVFKLGNFAFFSQRLHEFLIPIPSRKYLHGGHEYMQQNAILAPLRGPGGQVERVAISIVDNTDAVMYRHRLEEATRQLEEMSRTDPLTQIPNRRHLFEKLRAELSRSKRLGQPLSVAMIDLDQFKTVNDTYGHRCGDQVLRETAALLRNRLRPYDTIGRYGGEEFCIGLPNTELDIAQQVLDRLRRSVGDHVFAFGEVEMTRTVSMGVACTTGHAAIEVDDLVGLADAALYEAKTKGRNRLELSHPPGGDG